MTNYCRKRKNNHSKHKLRKVKVWIQLCINADQTLHYFSAETLNNITYVCKYLVPPVVIEIMQGGFLLKLNGDGRVEDSKISS